MPGYARRSDLNQKEIVNAFRGLGASVFSLHRVGDGCPDLLCGYKAFTFLVEVKNPAGKGTKYTDDQIYFRNTWRGENPFLCTCLEDVPKILEDVEKLIAATGLGER